MRTLRRRARASFPGRPWMVMLMMLAAPLVAPRALVAQTFSLGTPTPTSRLSVTTAVAGSPPSDGTLSAGTWSGKSGSSPSQPHNLSVQISSGSVPPGVTITITVTSNAGTVTGTQTLSASAVNLVTGIPRNTNCSGDITYTISATTAAGVVAAQSLSILFTMS